MDRTNLKVFLSSTFKDLLLERNAVEAVINRMGLTYVGMEHFGSFASDPLEECLAVACACCANGITTLFLYHHLSAVRRDVDDPRIHRRSCRDHQDFHAPGFAQLCPPRAPACLDGLLQTA